MRIIHNAFIPFRPFQAINLFGVLFCRKGRQLSPEVIRHEQIHTAQMKELCFVGFYLWYVTEWTIRLFMKGRAYSHLAMEREAYAPMGDPDYLSQRRHFAWITFLK